ncbi:MAG: glycoside hydrolase family 3 C-terminal domain-containing protein [Clostridia bacterium]|nr:glycoside hydrolase family 3 C-terminal domain-containing protein [Clostridia bacterium]
MDSFRNTLLSPEERASALLRELTLREKIGQINQHIYGFTSYEIKDGEFRLTDMFRKEVERWSGLGMLYGLYRADPWSQKDFTTGLTGDRVADAYNEVQDYVTRHSRFGIPVLLCEESPHGHQALDSYLLPVNLALGATWDPQLASKGFAVCGNQMAEQRVDLALVSMLDILRDPRWGRSEECYSEDPYLASRMAEAVVRGIMTAGLDVVAKHCCAQGETTGGVNASAARIGERELREIHLPAVEAAVRAGTTGIMAAYNEIDGIPCHGNPWLLKKVLRDEFGFGGFVMADGQAIDRLSLITNDDPAMQGAAALKSGVDVSLWDRGFTQLEKAITAGMVSEERLDEAVMRVLTLKFRRGLFEKPFMEKKIIRGYTPEEYPETLQLARESIVLLKNENGLLPLAKGTGSLAVISPLAADVYAELGDYTPPQRKGASVSILEGIWRAAGTEVDSLTAPIPKDPEVQAEYIASAHRMAMEHETVVLVLGGSSSRFADMTFEDNGAVGKRHDNGEYVNMTDCGEGVDVADLNLPPWQIALLEAVSSAGCRVITIMLGGRPFAMNTIAAHSNALCQAFYPGPMGGQAVAEILFGDVCPSGRLPVSLPNTAGQIPAYYNYRSSYTARYSDCPDAPVYSFGYGLSYTSFAVDDVCLEKNTVTADEMKKNGVSLSFKVRNEGRMEGTATVQLYVHDQAASVIPRVRMLKGFVRVPLIPGEEKTCTIHLRAEDLLVWNVEMEHVLEAGKFDLYLYEGECDRWSGELELTDC